ncbi:MAG: EamA family transporter [Steroidobacteraceae bacterium]
MKWSVFAFLCGGVLLNLVAQLGLKAATDATGPLFGAGVDVPKRLLELLTVPWLWVALTCYGLSVIVWLVGLSRAPVSQAYPMLSLNYVLMVGLAWWLFNEVPNLERVVGILVIVVGVVLVFRS